MAIGHTEGKEAILDLVRDGLTVEQAAHLMKAYGITELTGAEQDELNLAHAVAGVLSLLR